MKLTKQKRTKLSQQHKFQSFITTTLKQIAEMKFSPAMKQYYNQLALPASSSKTAVILLQGVTGYIIKNEHN